MVLVATSVNTVEALGLLSLQSELLNRELLLIHICRLCSIPMNVAPNPIWLANRIAVVDLLPGIAMPIGHSSMGSVPFPYAVILIINESLVILDICCPVARLLTI